MTRAALALIGLVALLTGCADIPPPTASASDAPSTAAASPATASPSAGDPELPEPGRPFDAATLLAAMRDSRRPDGVPDALETDAVASVVAESIWTLDSEPWEAISAGGSCGPGSCTLEISGAGEGAKGDDLWVFGVTPATGAVQLQSSDLRSLPLDLVARLDQLARSLVPHAVLDGLILTNVRWLAPPDDGQFVVSYRSGGEEGSCGADVTVDAVTPQITSGATSDC